MSLLPILTAPRPGPEEDFRSPFKQVDASESAS